MVKQYQDHCLATATAISVPNADSARRPEIEGAPLQLSVAILSQLRRLDIKRFRYKIGTAPVEAFALIKEKTRRLLA